MIATVALTACGLALAAAAPAPAGAADTLTVEDCIQWAAVHAPAVLAAAATVASAEADSVAARSHRRPTIHLEGGALVAPRGFYDPVATNLGEYRALIATHGTLFDAGEGRRAQTEARLAVRGAQADRAQAAREASLRAVELALDLVRHDRRADALEDQVAWLSGLSSVVDAGVRAGRRGRADLVRVQLELDAARVALVGVRGERGALERELAELVGRPLDRSLALAPPPVAALEPPTPGDSVAVLERSLAAPAVRTAEVERAKAELALLAVKQRRGLELTWKVDAGLWGTDLTRAVPLELAAQDPNAGFGDRLKRDLGASVSFEFDRRLTDPGHASNLAARAHALDAAGLHRRALDAEQRRAALDQLERWRTALAALDLDRTSAREAEDNVLRVRSLYEGGAASLLEVLDARTQVEDARLRLLEAQLAVWREHYGAEVP